MRTLRAGVFHPLPWGLLLLAMGFLPETGRCGWYTRSLPDSAVVMIRGETADTAALGNDRYVEDNLDYLLEHNEWVIVNFSAYWCPDSDDFAPGYRQAAGREEYAGIRWACAEVDGTAGNESFRKRFDLPGIPVVILFHRGEIIETADGARSVLDGHKGDKTLDDLLALLAEFYRPASPSPADTSR